MGKGSGGGTNTVVQNSQPPPQIMNAYTGLVNRAQNVANQPLQQYGGPLLAGFNPTQQAGFGAINNAAGAAQPYLGTATNYANAGATNYMPQQFTGSAVNQYLSPYQSDVINSTKALINQQNATQQQGVISSAIGSGNAFGGDRMGVAQAQLAENQALAANSTLSGLENQNYSQALGEFNAQQGVNLSAEQNNALRAANASYQMGALGQENQNTQLAGAQALETAGGAQQELQQEQLNIPYEQFLAQQSYPFQTANFLGSLVEGAGSGAGGTSTTQGPSPSGLSQAIGGIATGAGLIGETGGFGAGGWLTGLLGGGAALSGAGEAGALAATGAGAGGFLDALGGTGLALGALSDGGRVGFDSGGAVDTPTQRERQDLWMQFRGPRGYQTSMPPDDGALAPLGFDAGGAVSTPGYMMPSGNPEVSQAEQSDFTNENPAQLQQDAVLYPPTSIQGQAVRRALLLKGLQARGQLPGVPQNFGFGASPINPTSQGQTGATNAPPQGPEAPRGFDAGGGVGGINIDPLDNPNVDAAYGVGPNDPNEFSHPAALAVHSPGAPRRPSMNPSPQLAQGFASTPDAGAGFGGGAPGDGASRAGGAPSDTGGGFLDSPWYPLMQAGLGTLAGKSPFAAVNIGEGGERGLEALVQQKTEIPLKRAQAQEAQAQADVARMSAQIQGAWLPTQLDMAHSFSQQPGGMGGGVGGGGAAQGVSPTSAQGGGSSGGAAPGGGGIQVSAGPTQDTAYVEAPLDRYNMLMSQAFVFAGVPGMQQRSEVMKQMALNDPGFMFYKHMTDQGFQWDPQQGAFVVPNSELQGMQQQSTAKASGEIHDVRPGGFALQNGRVIARAPIMQKVVDRDPNSPTYNQEIMVPMYPPVDTSGGQGGGGGGGGASGGNNVGNIKSASGGFRQYPDLASGIEGTVDNLRAYGAKGINTINKIVSTWAPPSENDTASYIKDVAARTGWNPNQPLDMNDPRVLTQLTMAIAAHEQGNPAGGGGTQQGAAPTQSGAGATVTGTAPGAAAPVVERNPEEEQNLKNLAGNEQGSSGMSGDRKNYQASLAVQDRLNQMDHLVDQLNQTGWSSTGAGANTRMGILKDINGAFTAMGLQPIANPEKISSWEDFAKLTKNMGFDLSRTLGSREAQTIVQQATSAVPNSEMTYMGAKTVISALRQGAQRSVDWYKFETAWSKTHGGDTEGADIEFNELHPVGDYSKAAIAGAIPPKSIQKLKANPHYSAWFDHTFGDGMSDYVLGNTHAGQ